jgi:tetratricopeptide (TPR) repeat protein
VKLAEELDGLPLALATAGAYLKQTAMSFSGYLHLYKASWAKLQKTSPQLSSYKDRTLYSTWQLSFDRIKQQNELSAMLLRFWAYFDNQDIWFELLRHADPDDPEWIRELTEDELSFNDAVRVLGEHGLLDLNSSPLERIEARGYSIHGCVHSWTIHVLNEKWDYDLAKLALKLVGLHTRKEEETKWWLTQRRLLRHAARCSKSVLSGATKGEGMETSVRNLGYLFHSLGNLDEAEGMYQRALQGMENALGLDHASTLATVDDIGSLYHDQDKLSETEKMFHRALQGKEKVFGPEHTSTLDTVANLGRLYINQDKFEQANVFLQQALQGWEKALGPDHPSTLTTVNYLAHLYRRQEKLGEAKKMFQRALHGREKALGPDHTLTLVSVANLGCLYKKQGKLDKAEKMSQRALQGREKALGPDHVSTLASVHNLGGLYRNQGKLDEAEKMYQRALQGREKALGPDHTSTLNTVTNMGVLYETQDKLSEAKKMYSRAYIGYQATLGPSSNDCQSLTRKIARLDEKIGNPRDITSSFRDVMTANRSSDKKNSESSRPRAYMAVHDNANRRSRSGASSGKQTGESSRAREDVAVNDKANKKSRTGVGKLVGKLFM